MINQEAQRCKCSHFKSVRIVLSDVLSDASFSSRWTQTNDALEIEVASEEIEGHDLALEILLCLGQALWESASAEAREVYLRLLAAEIEAGVAGEIDEESLSEKRALFANRASARSRIRLLYYARASFASTVAEYIHSLWHDVTVRTGEEHLPAQWLRRRLEFLARWFPPDRGHRLFPGRR